MARIKPKSDKYRTRRGGRTRLLDIRCAVCAAWVLLYQKDGPGGLFRLYLNRIDTPYPLSGLQQRYRSERQMPALRCPACNALLGTPMRHSDGRLAFRLKPASVSKKQRG